VLEYFRACQQRNPRWKVPGKLHLLLLRQIEAEKNCIDLLYILKELGLSRALEQVKPDALSSGAPADSDAGAEATAGGGLGKAALVSGAKFKSLTGGLEGLMDAVMGATEEDEEESSFDVYASFS
jgi:hypothetical protein